MMPHWQNAVPGKPERNEKWTQLVPWLGSGDWPAHPAVRGTPNAVSVKEKAGTAQISKTKTVPSLFRRHL